MTAIFTGATMLGATVMGAMAMDLGHFPQPIITDGDWNGRLVIGENAGSQLDNAGAIEIASALPELGKIPVGIGGGEIVVEGGYEFDTTDLNAQMSGTFTESDIDGLFDDTFRWDGGDYDAYEKVVIAETYVATYLPDSSLGEEDFGSDLYLMVNQPGQIKYHYVFDEDLSGDFDARPLKIRMLGKEVEITGVDTDSVTVKSSSQFFMEVGDTVEVDGKTVELRNVGTTSVLVTVDGQTKALSTSDGEVEFEDADYFKVEVESMFYIEGADDNSATLKLGDELTQTVSDGDAMTLFGEPDDENEAEWLWDISFTGEDNITVDDYVGAVQNIKRSKVTVEDEDEERPALALGESLDFPNNYVSVEFVGFENADQSMYDDLVITPTNTRFGNAGYLDAMEITTTSDDSKALIIDDSSDEFKTDRIYAAKEGSNVLVYDGDKELVYNDTAANFAGNVTFTLSLEDNVVITPTDGNWSVALGTSGDVFYLNIDNTDFTKFGATEDEADAGDVFFLATDISEDDKLYRTTYGAIIDDMENGMDSDEFRITVPHEQKIPVVVVSTKDTQVIAGEAGTAYQYPVRPSNVMMLDTEAINRIGEIPMVVVGGPNANTVAAELLGVEQGSSDILELFSANKAMIRLFEDQSAILVAGYEGKDTYAASLALANFNNNKESFEGNVEVELSVPATTVTSIVGVN